MRTLAAVFLAAFLALCCGLKARAHGTEDHAAQAAAAPAPPTTVANRWGAGYFPNVPLVTHEGKTVRFYDDLLKGKSVAVNIIYTSCTNECPLETARLAQLQRLLGERMGKDIFFFMLARRKLYSNFRDMAVRAVVPIHFVVPPPASPPAASPPVIAAKP